MRIRIIVNGGGAPMSGGREFVMVTFSGILSPVCHWNGGGGHGFSSANNTTAGGDCGDVIEGHRVSGRQRHAAVGVRGRRTALRGGGGGRRSRRVMTRHRAVRAHLSVGGGVMMTTRRGVRVRGKGLSLDGAVAVSDFRPAVVKTSPSAAVRVMDFRWGSRVFRLHLIKNGKRCERWGSGKLPEYTEDQIHLDDAEIRQRQR